MHPDIEYSYQKAGEEIKHFVDGFWHLSNTGEEAVEVLLLPDGNVDLYLKRYSNKHFRMQLSGLSVSTDKVIIEPGEELFAISFLPLAVQYVLNDSVAAILNSYKELPVNFWGFKKADMDDFDLFCEKATKKILRALPAYIDEKLLVLQELLLEYKGDITTIRLSRYCGLSEEHLNFCWLNDVGLPLKTYLQILQFRAAFKNGERGKLYPQTNYFKKNVFEKEVSKLQRHLPRQLVRK